MSLLVSGGGRIAPIPPLGVGVMHPSLGQKTWQHFRLTAGTRSPQHFFLADGPVIKDKVFGRKGGQRMTETVGYIIATGQILDKMKY